MKTKKTVGEILETEWSPEFERRFRLLIDPSGSPDPNVIRANPTKFLDLRQRAMVMSYFKYGAVADSPPEIYPLGSIPARIERYVSGGSRGDVVIKSGNIEWLTDVYNFAMIQTMVPHVKLAEVPITEYSEGLRQVSLRPARILCAVDLFNLLKEPKPMVIPVLIAKWAFEEFHDPSHPKAYFKGTDNASPGRLNLEEDGEHFLSEHPH